MSQVSTSVSVFPPKRTKIQNDGQFSNSVCQKCRQKFSFLIEIIHCNWKMHNWRMTVKYCLSDGRIGKSIWSRPDVAKEVVANDRICSYGK